MSFITVPFAVFVSITLLVYYLFPKKYRWIILLIASYVFYCLNDAGYLIYIIITTISAYICAAVIEGKGVRQKQYLQDNKETLSREEKKSYKAGVKRAQRLVLVIGLCLNFGILAIVKYRNPSLTILTDQIIAYINMYRLNWFGINEFIPFRDYVMPLGISFYTFQTMGYLIDIYYGKYEREKNLFRFALFVSFFPQIIQGPISRFGQLAPELFRERSFDFSRIKSGFYRVLWGLFKKLVIADRVAGLVSSTIEFRENYNGFYIILAIFAYSMQIYGDFSGGIDVAAGVAEMFGINLTENFERPFFSKSISEYWQRWHITLGTWFRDYVFYPLSINKTVIKIGKAVKEHGFQGLGKRLPIYIPMFFVWLITGMWHGSQSRFVVWGLFNFVFIVLGTELEPVSQRIVSRLKLNENSLYMKTYRVAKTFWLMTFLRIFDISKDVPAAFETFGLIFRSWSAFDINKVYEHLMLPKEDFIVAIIAVIILFIFELIQRKGSVRKRIFALPVPLQWCILSLLIVAVSVFGYYGPGYDAGSFIYGAF